MENHQKETITPSLLSPTEDESHSKYLRPVTTHLTPIQSPNRSESALSESAVSPTPTSDLENDNLGRSGAESADATDEDEDDDEEDIRELEGRMVTNKGQMVISQCLLFFSNLFRWLVLFNFSHI